MKNTKAPKGQEVYGHLRKRGVPETAAKAMVANIAVESGYTFDPSVKQEGERSDPAYGLFQFDPRGSGLAKVYEKYLEDTDQEDGMEAQLDFFVDSVYGNYKEGREHIGFGNVSKFKEAAADGDLIKATKEFSQRLLKPGKPHLERRINAAKNIKQYIGNADEILEEEEKVKSLGMPEGYEEPPNLEEALRQVVPQVQGQVSPLSPVAAPNKTKWTF